MTQEEKQLLLKDLCARLPYGVKVRVTDALNGVEYDSVVYAIHPNSATAETYDDEHGLVGWPSLMLASFKPYLRPMSSMTEEEIFEFVQISERVLGIGEKKYTCILSLEQMDWLNERHFDYRGLIEKGLALEAPEGMYKTE